MNLSSLSVVVPAHNEAHRLGASLARLLEWLPAHVQSFEIVVVDDGSTDGTADVARAAADPRVRLVVRDQRGGKGAAVRSGIETARLEWTLVVDADLSIPIEELARLEPRAADHQIVIGSKWSEGAETSYPPLRRLLSLLSRWVVAVFVVPGFKDTQCGFKLFRTDVARSLFACQLLTGYGFDFEILYLARRFGYAVAEVAIRCKHTQGGQVALGSYWRTLLELATVVAHKLRGSYPARPPAPGTR